MFHTLPRPVRVIPLFRIAGLAPIPNEIVLDDRLIITKPFLLALDATTCAEEVVTLAVAGVEPVSGVLVLTVPDIVADDPIPGFCDMML